MTGFLEFVKSLVGLLNVPGVVSDNIVSFFEKNGVAIPANGRPWFALAISLFICAVPVVYDRLRSPISKNRFCLRSAVYMPLRVGHLFELSWNGVGNLRSAGKRYGFLKRSVAEAIQAPLRNDVRLRGSFIARKARLRRRLRHSISCHFNYVC